MLWCVAVRVRACGRLLPTKRGGLSVLSRLSTAAGGGLQTCA